MRRAGSVKIFKWLFIKIKQLLLGATPHSPENFENLNHLTYPQKTASPSKPVNDKLGGYLYRKTTTCAYVFYY